MENFFENPTTLRNPQHFVGRHKLLERIFELIKGKHNISLYGPRRIGKTSLLACVRSPAIQQKYAFDGCHFLFLYLDLQDRSLKTGVSFLDDIGALLHEQAELLGFDVAQGSRKSDEIGRLLETFQRQELYPVVMLDGFDEIRNQAVNQNMFNFLRAKATAEKISFVIASLEKLGDIFGKLWPEEASQGSSPFHNIFATLPLGAFTPDEAYTYLVDTSTKGHLPFQPDEVQWVLQLAGYHPFLLQQVATLLFVEKRAAIRQGRTLDESQLAQIQEEAQQNLSPYFEDCWNLLSPADRKTLQKQLATLKKDGSLKTQAGLIRADLCYSELFRSYQPRSKNGTASFNTSNQAPPLEDLKIILEHLDNLGDLGESFLSKIPPVARRIEQQRPPTAMKRGAIVHAALLEALDCLKGLRERNDGSPDWLHYNILYYNYFMRRHSMNKDQIAARLSISPRHYYRHVPEALTQFWNALLALDEIT
jgi:hypothetical protein